MANSNKSWAGGIRRQVFELFGILIALVMVAGGYELWSHWSIERVREETNNYHLVANSHYLRAMEDLRNLRSHHVSRLKSDSAPHRHSSDSELILEDSYHTTLHYLVDKQIESGLVLERRYADYRFDMMSRRLDQQLLSLSELYTAFEMNAASDEDLQQVTVKLLTTLDQIVRLHSIMRDRELEALHRKEHFQGNVFYILIGLLLLGAVLVARRGLKSIDRIIHKQMRAEDKIKHQAHYDNLTKLPNRFLALDRLSQMIKEARRAESLVAVLFIDLDYFKKVNDMLGHVSADKLLVEAARRITQSVRADDTVGRLGGDEFIVLSGGIHSADEVMTIAENLIKHINEAFTLEGKELILTASIGISVFPSDGDDKLELIRKADSAMYHSKESGRNTYSYFDESMNRNISRQLELEEQIHGALDRGEFEVVYQQKVELIERIHSDCRADRFDRADRPVRARRSPENDGPVATGFTA
jgi:diguanylate cyclase (GGDEF)-like protein